MRSFVEPAQRNPMRDNSEQAQSSHIDLRCQGKPEQSPDNEDQEKTSLMKLLMKRVLEAPNENAMMAELFPKNDDKEYQKISEDPKKYCWRTAQYRSSWNVHDHRRNVMPDVLPLCFLDTCCTCGQANPGASDKVKEQVFTNEMNCFNILATSAFVLELGNPGWKPFVAAKAPNCVSKRETISRVSRKSANSAFLIDIWKTNDIEYTFSQKMSPKTKSKTWDRFASGPKRDHVNVNFGEAHTTWSKQQQVEQTVWPPPSIPICQKQKNGIERIFVDEDATLPHNHRLPAASGKIGVVGNMERIQVRHQKDCKGRKEGRKTCSSPSPQIERPVHSRSRTWNSDAAAGAYAWFARALHGLRWEV